MERIYLDNDHAVHLTGLADGDGAAVTSATVEARVMDSSGADVSGVTWPVALTHTGSGNYSGTIDKAIVLQEGAIYYLDVTATASGMDANWRIPHVSTRRK